MAKKSILFIEDEKSLIKNLEMAFEGKYKFIGALNGQEGVKKAQTNPPDLILLDILLPDVDGFEVLKQLKANSKTQDIPILVLTNLGDQETISKILAAGGKEYMVKADWGIDEVIKKVEEALED